MDQIITRAEADQLLAEGKISKNLFKAMRTMFDRMENLDLPEKRRESARKGLILATQALESRRKREEELWPEDEDFCPRGATG